MFARRFGLLEACAAFVAGAVVGLAWPASAFPLAACGSLVLALALWRRSATAVVACGLLVVGAFAGRRAQAPPPEAIARACAGDLPVRLQGVITRGPDPSDEDGARLRMTVTRVDDRASDDAAVELRVKEGWHQLAPGDELRVRARVRCEGGFANEGEIDPALVLRVRGLHAAGSVPRGESIALARRGALWSPRRLAYWAHAVLARVVDRTLPPREAAFVRAAVLGERAAVTREAEDGFRAAGATHVLSVSGLHLGVIAALALALGRLGAGRVTWLALRVPPLAAGAFVAAPAVLFYTLVTGEAVATWRAALMALVLCGARAFARPFSARAAVAAAALVLVADAPLVLLDVSFQLSFVSVLALVAFSGGLSPAPAARSGGRARRMVVRIGGWLGRMMAATIAAGALTTPLVALHFGEVALGAPVGNVLLVPLVELVVVPLGLAGAALGAVWQPLGWLPLETAAVTVRVALAVAGWFLGHVPVPAVPRPTWLEVCGLVLCMAALLALPARLPVPRRASWLAAAGGALVAVVSFGARWAARELSSDLRVTFVDVGQGDAAVVEGPRGFVALIDGGGLPGTSFDVGARVLEPYLRRRGIGRIHLVALSHPHPDHMDGLRRVLERFRVDELWTSGDGRHPAYEALLALARARGVRITTPATRTVHGLVIEPTGPWDGWRIAVPPGLSVNDASLSLRLAFAGRALLFPGDLEEDGEVELVGRTALGLPIASDVLKVPHHGSRTSSTPELLDAAHPGIAVISCGRGNRFGFPHAEVLARYADRGVRVLRTDLGGAVTVAVASDGSLRATCVRGCR